MNPDNTCPAKLQSKQHKNHKNDVLVPVGFTRLKSSVTVGQFGVAGLAALLGAALVKTIIAQRSAWLHQYPPNCCNLWLHPIASMCMYHTQIFTVRKFSANDCTRTHSSRHLTPAHKCHFLFAWMILGLQQDLESLQLALLVLSTCGNWIVLDRCLAIPLPRCLKHVALNRGPVCASVIDGVQIKTVSSCQGDSCRLGIEAVVKKHQSSTRHDPIRSRRHGPGWVGCHSGHSASFCHWPTDWLILDVWCMAIHGNRPCAVWNPCQGMPARVAWVPQKCTDQTVEVSV